MPRKKTSPLRKLRRAAKLTQVQLAKLSGLSQPEISLMESGQVGCGPVRAKRLAKVLKVRISDLVT